jgi:hypothetical protein
MLAAVNLSFDSGFYAKWRLSCLISCLQSFDRASSGLSGSEKRVTREELRAFIWALSCRCTSSPKCPPSLQPSIQIPPPAASANHLPAQTLITSRWVVVVLLSVPRLLQLAARQWNECRTQIIMHQPDKISRRSGTSNTKPEPNLNPRTKSNLSISAQTLTNLNLLPTHNES